MTNKTTLASPQLTLVKSPSVRIDPKVGGEYPSDRNDAKEAKRIRALKFKVKT